MALPVGSRVPPFSLPGSDGRTHSDASLRGTPYVLTFYPKDETPGCVAQVCAFRDIWEDFRAMGVQVFGVSRDDLESHERFVAKRNLPYVLLTDASGQFHKALQIGRNLFGGANRVSFLVDAQGVIRDVFEHNLRADAHAERMAQSARALPEG